jgi:transcriptional regulator with XRE-family HTH domain
MNATSEVAVPHHVDIHVGQRLRRQRSLCGITQQDLAEQVGVRFQQIQKYESGSNRISASRLWDVAQVLQVPVAFFFDGLNEASAQSDMITDLMRDHETVQLVRAYNKMTERRQRQLCQLAEVLRAS